MKKLAVLVVHGMGDQDSDFADGMVRELEGRLEARDVDPSEIAWKSVWWAPVLSEMQSELWLRMRRGNDLDYRRLRQFVLHALGDAVAYRKTDKKGPGEVAAYEDIHERVATKLTELREATRFGKPSDAPEVPLFLIAHSLGCHIMSNFIWDRQRAKKDGLNEFEQMKTLTGIHTFGCNIPLFALAHKNPQPIDFPLDVKKYFPKGTGVRAIEKVARWRNYYDPDDILGWPLKPLSDEYNHAVYKDVDINVGGLFSSWNPASHSRYWTDNDFTKPTADAIAGILELL